MYNDKKSYSVNGGSNMFEREKQYDFRKKLLEVHKKNVRNTSLVCKNDELEIANGVCVVIPENANEVIYTAAKDFADYLLVSMNVGAMVSNCCPEGAQKISLSISDKIGEASGYMGYSITTCENGIEVVGYDDVGIMQGLFFLEDLMNIRKAPFIKYGNIKRKSLFELRITQSPFGMFEYPDEAFAIIAHRGYNAIELWMKEPYVNKRGDYTDLKLLSDRAKKYGIKIYIETYIHHSVHPDEDGAQEFYDKMYGEFFEVCPDIAGITLVGEACQFSSRDPHVGLAPHTKNYIENIPTGKISPGWWPCEDYPDLVRMVSRSIKKYNPQAELILCSYNWGFAPEEDRVKLIENLPKDTILLATWDMFHYFRMGDSVQSIVDYSLKFTGPGEYFSSEAIAAKRCGIRLATISNTAGRTWDFGVIPYEPMPTQWIKRFKKMIEAHKEWGLWGLMENIHYGFHPSIIGDLEKWAFFTEIKPLEEVLQDLLKRDFEENADSAGKAMEDFSEGITYYSITNDDQYGAFRIGPAYPVWVSEKMSAKRPFPSHAMFKGMYFVPYLAENAGKNSIVGVRIFEEIKSLKTMAELFLSGIKILQECKNPNENLMRLLNLAQFMYNTTVTGIHVKEMFVLSYRLAICETKENATCIIDKMEKLLLRERENVENTIPLVQCDSRLGWEPSMEYVGDEASLRWKLRQLDYDINCTIRDYRTANGLVDIYTNKE